MESDAIQSIFNLLVSVSVFGFMLIRRQSLKEIMPFWTLLTPVLLLNLMELESLIAHVVLYDSVLIHRVLFLLLLTSLLILVWNLPTPVRKQVEGP